MQAGATDDKIRAVPTWRDSELFSAMEKDALEYAERMTTTGEKVTDELWGAAAGPLHRGPARRADRRRGGRELPQQVQRAARAWRRRGSV